MLLAIGCGRNNQQESAKKLQKERYEPEWDSLSKYEETAEWFKDAKFGIYAHWGILSVPAYANDWYPRNMHIEGTDEYRHHVETYGEHSEFGYHDYVPMFRAEAFDPDAWVDLFQKAGAKFPTCEWLLEFPAVQGWILAHAPGRMLHPAGHK